MSRNQIYIVSIPKDWKPKINEIKEIYEKEGIGERGYSFDDAYKDVLKNIEDLKTGIPFTDFRDNFELEQTRIIEVLCERHKFLIQYNEVSSHSYAVVFGIPLKDIPKNG
jgi:hypothetical protein